MAKFLISKGANVKAEDINGNNASKLVQKTNNKEMLKVLIKMGLTYK